MASLELMAVMELVAKHTSHRACSSPAALGTGIQPVMHSAQAPVVVASPTGHWTQSLWSSFGCLPAGHICSRPASDHQCTHETEEKHVLSLHRQQQWSSRQTHLASAATSNRCFASITLLAETSRCSPTSSTGYATALVVICFCTRTAPAPIQTNVAERQLVEASI